MAASSDIEDVYSLIFDENYKAAEKLIQRLRDKRLNHCDLLLYEAICAYERSDDINCLRLLSRFLQAAPQHKKRHYATFTACVCLANLGLCDEALKLLQRIPSSYPSRDSEIENAKRVLDKRRVALEHAESIHNLLASDTAPDRRELCIHSTRTSP